MLKYNILVRKPEMKKLIEDRVSSGRILSKRIAEYGLD
jgi:hypothetical protein